MPRVMARSLVTHGTGTVERRSLVPGAEARARDLPRRGGTLRRRRSWNRAVVSAAV